MVKKLHPSFTHQITHVGLLPVEKSERERQTNCCETKLSKPLQIRRCVFKACPGSDMVKGVHKCVLAKHWVNSK